MDRNWVGHGSTKGTTSSSNKFNDSDSGEEDVDNEEIDNSEDENVTMDNAVGRSAIQLIDQSGYFKDGELENLIQDTNLGQYGTSYLIVAIIGPQSSGKSTLLNYLFQTQFTEMKAGRGRTQTTNGIWLGYNDVIKPCTLVMDIEGSDGEERGTEDTKFERQTALFALAVADVVLINIWCYDIGREKAANRSLFEIVFKVMGKLYKPRKITLIFIIRDHDERNAHALQSQLLSNIQKIWKSIFGKSTAMNQFFNIEVVSLPHYRFKKTKFTEQVTKLRDSICDPNANHAQARNQRDIVPASVLTEHLQTIWNGIKQNKDIDIPSHAFTLASHKCDEILDEKLKFSLASEQWKELRKTVEGKSVDDLGRRLTSIINAALSAYDEATTHFEDNVKSTKRQLLKERLVENAKEDFTSSMGHTRSTIWKEFIGALRRSTQRDGQFVASTARELGEDALKKFDRKAKDATPEQAIWNSSAIRNQLKNEIDDQIAGLINSKIPEILEEHRQKMKKALDGEVKRLLLDGGDDPWQLIREHLDQQSNMIVGEYSDALSHLYVSSENVEFNESMLINYGRELVKETAKVESENILNHMELRFMNIFFEGRDLGAFTKQKEIDELAQKGRIECLKLLSTMAVIRLDRNCSDSVDETLYRNLIESSSTEQLSINNHWRGVNDADILLRPSRCLEIWKAFVQKTSFSIRKKLSWRKVFEDIVGIVSNALAPFVRLFT